jgi:hypothetical protein
LDGDADTLLEGEGEPNSLEGDGEALLEGEGELLMRRSYGALRELIGIESRPVLGLVARTSGGGGWEGSGDVITGTPTGGGEWEGSSAAGGKGSNLVVNCSL